MLKRIFGSSNARKLKKMNRNVKAINELEGSLLSLTGEQLGEKTQEFKKRYEKGETLNELLPEAFAVVREASKRAIGLRPFDVQLIGGMVLHDGNISEMRTGEGKTLVATLPAYLNGLSGLGVHIVTVNEYLAQRDADWMRPIFELLGFTVGVIKSEVKITVQDILKVFKEGKRGLQLNSKEVEGLESRAQKMIGSSNQNIFGSASKG